MDSEMTPVDNINVSVLSAEHADILATKWWGAGEFKLRGISCREGVFMEVETDRIRTAISEYQKAQNLSEQEVLCLIFGANKQQGFWAHLTRTVPPRRIRSVYDHVQRIYHPLRNKGDWTDLEDTEMKRIIEEHGPDWVKVANALERTAAECRSRYEKCLAHEDTRRQGAWSAEEESRLVQIMQAFHGDGKSTQTSIKFWQEVAGRMDHTRTAHQCRNKWTDSIYPRLQNGGTMPRWSYIDNFILVRKVASLDLDMEKDIEWSALPDNGWKAWNCRKLQQKWASLKKIVHSPGATHRSGYMSLSHQCAYH